jgi:thiol-disulfide isomerase/thioredoxin
MITVKIFGATPPCLKCKEVVKRASKVAEKYPGQIELAKFDTISEEGRKYGIMLIPTVVVNDKIISIGKIISESDLEEAIKKELEGGS